MWKEFCLWWIANGTYTIIRNIAELFYFIVLTGAIVYYTAKSYRKSVEVKPEIVTHIYVDYKDRLERGRSDYPIYLEIYNCGNGIAKNIVLSVDDEELSKGFSVFNNDLGFLQPQHSKFIPLGSLSMTLGDNFLSVFNSYSRKDDFKDISFYIQYSGKKKEKIRLNFDYVLNMPRTPIGKTSDESIDEKQVKQLEAINKSLGNIKGSVEALTKKIK
ncbi:MAG: hypothetical protein ACYDEX_08130 [Mobilitalea sp.]